MRQISERLSVVPDIARGPPCPCTGRPSGCPSRPSADLLRRPAGKTSLDEVASSVKLLAVQSGSRQIHGAHPTQDAPVVRPLAGLGAGPRFCHAQFPRLTTWAACHVSRRLDNHPASAVFFAPGEHHEYLHPGQRSRFPTTLPHALRPPFSSVSTARIGDTGHQVMDGYRRLNYPAPPHASSPRAGKLRQSGQTLRLGSRERGGLEDEAIS